MALIPARTVVFAPARAAHTPEKPTTAPLLHGMIRAICWWPSPSAQGMDTLRDSAETELDQHSCRGTSPWLPSGIVWWGRRGSHTTTRELQTCTLDGPGASKHHQNSTRRHTEKKSETGGGRRKKNAKFWALHPWSPTLRGPIFLGFGPFGP